MRIKDFCGRVCYFGKLPGRTDFVRSSAGAPILDQLDAWIGHGLELAATDPGWKPAYDAAAPLDFAFLGTRKSFAIVGRLMPSQDASQRRFPFMAATAIPCESSQLGCFPLAFAPTWHALAAGMRGVLDGADPRVFEAELLPAFDDAAVGAHREALGDRTLGLIEQALRDAGHAIDVRRSILALGLLLEPLLTRGDQSLQRGLALPLPEGEMGIEVASFWMAIVALFLSRGDFEICAILTRRMCRPELVLAFSGAGARALQAAFSRCAAAEFLVEICNADWVDDYTDNDNAIKKLSSYLEIPRLSLRQALESFGDAFFRR
jgi:type VI secretion system protein ImpM